MRFVPVNCLRENMVLARTLFGEKGEVLLHAGTKLLPNYIRRIQDMGYNGLYIEDELSKDIEVEEVVSSNLRVQAVQSIKKIFTNFENKKANDPQQFKDLSKLIENIMHDISGNKNMIVNMIDLKTFDDYTYFHSVNVAILSMIIGCSMGLPSEQLHKLGLGAILHDIGKIYVPKNILNKEGKLTPEEYEIIKKHPEKGYAHLKEHFNIPTTSYVAVLHHHERYDGLGYPNGLAKDKISLFGRIISVADVYDAVTSDRPYRKGLPPSEAMEMIMGGGGTMFDPEIVAYFTKKVAPYPVGTCVLLSDNREAIVVENYENLILRPLVRVYKENGVPVSEQYQIDLRKEEFRNIVIKTTINQ